MSARLTPSSPAAAAALDPDSERLSSKPSSPPDPRALEGKHTVYALPIPVCETIQDDEDDEQ
jgi:hypothetical protein